MIRLSGADVGLWLPCKSLWRREIVRFLRQRSRVVGALGTPIVFWLLLGAGLQNSMQTPGAITSIGYKAFSFPGAIAAILLFTAIFSTISLIDDRREGFLQAVLVAPVPRTAIALGKVLGATTLAVAQAGIFLVFSSFAGVPLGFFSTMAVIMSMILLAFAVTSLGFWIAWRMESTQGFHAIMNLVLMPMLVLSGAFFPPSGSAPWLQAVIAMNPMTYGVALLRHALSIGNPLAEATSGPSVGKSIGITFAFAIITFLLALLSVRSASTRAST